jgi:phospholipid/cholesterol/gamma-HCH transport system substrate-binding protein
MKNSLETRLGFFAALIVIAAVLMLETLGSLDNFKKGRRLHAQFSSAQELKVGDRVKMAGVEIGRVDAISLADSKVQVTMRVAADAPVKTDSVATIRFAGLMGQKFVSLSFGSQAGQPADDNTHLPTREQADMNAIMQRLDNVAAGVENLTKSFSGDKIDNILGPLTDFFKQNSGQVSATLTNLKVITAQVAEGKGTIGKLIMDESLYSSSLTTVSNLEFATKDMRVAIGDARATLADARAGKGTVGKLLTDDSLFVGASGSMSNLNEILSKINRGDGSVGKLVNQDEFYQNAKLTLQKLDKATESLEDQGPISVLGSLFSALY